MKNEKERLTIASQVLPHLINDNMTIGAAAAFVGVEAKDYSGDIHWPQVCAKRALNYADTLLKEHQRGHSNEEDNSLQGKTKHNRD